MTWCCSAKPRTRWKMRSAPPNVAGTGRYGAKTRIERLIRRAPVLVEVNGCHLANQRVQMLHGGEERGLLRFEPVTLGLADGVLA